MFRPLKYATAALLALTPSCLTAKDLSVDYTAQASASTNYMAVMGFTVEDEPVIQKEVVATVNGVSAGDVPIPLRAVFWDNYNINRGRLSEIDYGVGTTLENDSCVLDIDLTIFSFMGPLGDFPDTTDLKGALTFKKLPLDPRLIVRYGDYQEDEGVYAGIEVGKEFSLTDNTALSLTGSYGWLDGYFIKYEGPVHASLDLSLLTDLGDDWFGGIGVLMRNDQSDGEATTDDIGLAFTIGRNF